MSRPVIITCAVTGSIHTPTMSPYLPLTPQAIADQAVEAAQAGAAILHLHARDPATGLPSSDPALFEEIVGRIGARCDAVLNLSTGGSSRMTLDERLAAARRLRPQMCSLNMGSMNFGLFPLAGRYTDWKHDWEPGFLEATRSVIFRNSFEDIETILGDLGGAGGARFELECYDVGHLQTVAFYLEKGLIKAPVFVQFVFGVLGGIDAAPEQLMHMKATADRLLGTNYRFSVLAAGRHQMPLGTMGVILGGHVRVGLEDNLSIARGRLATSNAEQVAKIRRIVEELGHRIATPDEARAELGIGTGG
ncbi:3-keto-5-aminohexanoate cleavage protein [Starkeya koreensis]|uniref:3-keto-5-aminohexanoate cleavage protein n=1 Tax=Ancylobacter koreensis TaxID=266121 RepID=A0ABT0DJE9_9HYPH|nr:3-keto-5-aminohexanoate cleavage protein [Ancylobacter koreensis]MCK0207406.1 3-keto-5-aminohexanoate cleavage protein [Ancylobacter koreensis]